jgi:hypothetical protein
MPLRYKDPLTDALALQVGAAFLRTGEPPFYFFYVRYQQEPRTNPELVIDSCPLVQFDRLIVPYYEMAEHQPEGLLPLLITRKGDTRAQPT